MKKKTICAVMTGFLAVQGIEVHAETQKMTGDIESTVENEKLKDESIETGDMTDTGAQVDPEETLAGGKPKEEPFVDEKAQIAERETDTEENGNKKTEREEKMPSAIEFPDQKKEPAEKREEEISKEPESGEVAEKIPGTEDLPSGEANSEKSDFKESEEEKDEGKTEFTEADRETDAEEPGLKKPDQEEVGEGPGLAEADQEEAGKGSGFTEADREEAGKGPGLAKADQEEAGKGSGLAEADQEEAGKGPGLAEADQEEAGKGSGFTEADREEAGKGPGLAEAGSEKSENLMAEEKKPEEKGSEPDETKREEPETDGQPSAERIQPEEVKQSPDDTPLQKEENSPASAETPSADTQEELSEIPLQIVSEFVSSHISPQTPISQKVLTIRPTDTSSEVDPGYTPEILLEGAGDTAEILSCMVNGIEAEYEWKENRICLKAESLSDGYNRITVKVRDADGIVRSMKPWEVNVKPKPSVLVSRRAGQESKRKRFWQSLRRFWNLLRSIAEIQNQTTRYLRALCRK